MYNLQGEGGGKGENTVRSEKQEWKKCDIKHIKKTQKTLDIIF
jgi:hypothetical protein